MHSLRNMLPSNAVTGTQCSRPVEKAIGLHSNHCSSLSWLVTPDSLDDLAEVQAHSCLPLWFVDNQPRLDTMRCDPFTPVNARAPSALPFLTHWAALSFSLLISFPSFERASYFAFFCCFIGPC